MTDKRLWWVDWSKSICIFLMVVGHSFYPEKGSIDWMTKNLIYSFHMPLFFFVSGYLTKYKDEKFIQFLKRQVKSLLIPYVFFNVVCFIIGLPISKFAIDNNRVIDTFIGGGHSFAGATWFLLSLFWIKILNHFVVQLGGGKFIIATSLFMATVVYFLPQHVWFGLPAALLAYPIFSLGYLLRGKDVFFSFVKGNKSLLFSVSSFLLLIVNYINGSTAMFSLGLGRYPLLYYPEILIGLIMIVTLSMILEKWKPSLIKLFSSGSIVIMGTHGGITPYAVFILNIFGVYTMISVNTLADALTISVIVSSLSIPVVIYFQKYLYMMIGNRK